MLVSCLLFAFVGACLVAKLFSSQDNANHVNPLIDSYVLTVSSCVAHFSVDFPFFSDVGFSCSQSLRSKRPSLGYVTDSYHGHHSTLGSPPLPWSSLDRLVVFIIDQSGSMDPVITTVRSSIAAVAKDGFGVGIPVHYIVFDAYAGDSNNLDNLPSRSGSTDIAVAFVHLYKLIAKNGLPRRLDLVFVSDGEDAGAAKKLAMFIPLPDDTRFYSVGVGDQFPFDVVFGVMLARFGKGNDPAATPVFPLDRGEDALCIFKDVVEELLREAVLPPPSLLVVSDKTSSKDAIFREVVRAYNRCMHSYFVGVTSVEDRREERDAALEECSAFIAEAAETLREMARGVKRSTTRPRVVDDADRSPHDLLVRIISFNSRVKKLRELLAIGQEMDQNAKRLIAGLAGRFGAAPVYICPFPRALRPCLLACTAPFAVSAFGLPVRILFLSRPSCFLRTRMRTISRGVMSSTSLTW